MSRHSTKTSLEIVVSSQDLGMLPDDMVKIMFVKEGIEVEPKKRLYKYGVESLLEIQETRIEINPLEKYVSIGKEKIYVSGIVDLIVSNGDISIQRYGNIQKFMNIYRQRLEKEHLRKKYQYKERYEEEKKKDRDY